VSTTTEQRLAAILQADKETLSRIDAVLFQKSPITEVKINRPLTIAESARMLGKSRGTLHRWLNSGAVKCVQVTGGNRLIPFSEIERIAGGVR
jgi:excisionase family DNA binding protein